MDNDCGMAWDFGIFAMDDRVRKKYFIQHSSLCVTSAGICNVLWLVIALQILIKLSADQTKHF